ncbi:MAG: peroxiredoxin [Pirellulaceae bacterium]
MKVAVTLSTALLILTACNLSAAEKKAAEPKLAEAGQKAPAFSALDDQGKEWKSSEHVGKKVVVVYFYPADMTGGCTKQACAFRDDKSKLAEMGVEVVGVSGDTVANHQLFKKAEKLNFTLLADPEGKVAAAFGVPQTKGEKSITREIEGLEKILTRGTTIQRYTVVIGKDGTIAKVYKVADAAGDSQNILELVKSLN